MAKSMLYLKVLLAGLLILSFAVYAQQNEVEAIRVRYRQSPNDAAVQERMIANWLSMATGMQQSQVLEETTPALSAATDAKHRNDILFVRARAAILLPSTAPEQTRAIVEDFIKAAPQDDRSAELLFRLARAQPDAQAQATYYQRAVDQYPTTYWGILSKGSLTQAAGVGKPFELQFNDAISGKPVDVQRDFKGKVVVVYFWATWCSDCAAELPQMKQLYATYKAQGVEFIGVSLDEPEAAGGLTKLKEYVATNAVPWPQYFQGGNKQLSPFSSGWGVSATPTAFVIDKEGKLHSTNAKGQIERMIQEVLAKPTT